MEFFNVSEYNDEWQSVIGQITPFQLSILYHLLEIVKVEFTFLNVVNNTTNNNEIHFVPDMEGDIERLYQHLIRSNNNEIIFLGDLFGDFGCGNMRILSLVLYLSINNKYNFLSGNRDVILLRISSEMIAFSKGFKIVPYWVKSEDYLQGTNYNDFLHTIASKSMAAPRLVEQLIKEYNSFNLSQFGSFELVLNELFFNPNSVLSVFLMRTKYIIQRNYMIYSHIALKEERIFRNLDGTLSNYSSIQDWCTDINNQWFIAVNNIYNNGLHYNQSIMNLTTQQQFNDALWICSKNCTQPGWELFRAAMGVEPSIPYSTEMIPTYSLLQGASIEIIDGFTKPFSMKHLKNYGIHGNITAHKPHTGFNCSKEDGVISVCTDYLRMENAKYLILNDNNSNTWTTYDKNTITSIAKNNNYNIPNTSTYGYEIYVKLVSDIFYGSIRFPMGATSNIIFGKNINSNTGTYITATNNWMVLSDNCTIPNDNNKYWVLVTQYEKFPNFSLYIVFVKYDELYKLNNINLN